MYTYHYHKLKTFDEQTCPHACPIGHGILIANAKGFCIHDRLAKRNLPNR